MAIDIKIRRNKGTEDVDVTLNGAINETNGSLNGDGHNLKNGEPAIFETMDDSNGKSNQYLSVGSPNPDIATTSPSDAKYVKLQPKEKVDNVLYKGTDSSNIITLQDDTGTNKKLSITCGGTGKDSLYSNSILVGSGQNAINDSTLRGSSGSKKAVYFDGTTPTVGILQPEAGGTGESVNNISDLFSQTFGVSKIITDYYTPSTSPSTNRDALITTHTDGSTYTCVKLECSRFFNNKKVIAIYIMPRTLPSSGYREVFGVLLFPNTSSYTCFAQNNSYIYTGNSTQGYATHIYEAGMLRYDSTNKCVYIHGNGPTTNENAFMTEGKTYNYIAFLGEEVQ